MSADLPPDVRDRAAQALRDSFNPPAIMSWDELCDESREMWRGHVDAVAEVLEGDDGSYHVCAQQIDWWRKKHAEAKARVDLLTTALTELVDLHNIGADGGRMVDAAWANARAALSATPTAPTPHTCQLPDIATVREPSSFNDRRWDCPVCDARWIAMGRMVGRRSRYEWRQMPVTKTATPTEDKT